MKVLKSLILSCSVLATLSVVAQDNILDGAYEKVTLKEREIIPYDHIREADVFWSKRIWRVVDTREKMNLPFRYPQKPLIDIVHTAAKNGELQVYDPVVQDADQFKQSMTTKDVSKIGSKVDSTMTIDPITLKEVQTVTVQEFEARRVVKFKIKEDWFFDEETSTMQVRIIGIAPVMEKIDENGNVLGDQTMYWVYYPDLRPILAKYQVYNSKNDGATISWEDLFEMRYFASYVVKESNAHDRMFSEYATGFDILYENERVSNEIRNFEHDLWEY